VSVYIKETLVIGAPFSSLWRHCQAREHSTSVPSRSYRLCNFCFLIFQSKVRYFNRLLHKMSVHDILFLPGDEDSILNQGVEGAAGDPQVFGGNSFAGGQQGSAVGSRLNLGG
jgi:hypothetical protein